MSEGRQAEAQQDFAGAVLDGAALQNPRGGRSDYLTSAVVLSLLFLVVLLVIRIISNAFYPFIIDTGEGTVLAGAWRVACGEPAYGTIESPPHAFTIYNPVLIYLGSLAYKAVGTGHAGIRLLAACFYLGAGGAVYLFVRRETAMKSAALVAMLFFLVERHLYSRAGYAVTDYPGIFFSVLGLWLWRGGGKTRYAAVFSFALAFFSKQTSIMAAAAAFSALFLEGKRLKAVGFFALFLALVGVGMGIAGLLWGRPYFLNTLHFASIAPLEVHRSVRKVAVTLVLYVVPVTMAFVYAWKSIRDKRLLLPVLYVFFGLILASMSGKVGASRSYIFDLAAALSIITGLAWSQVRAKALAGDISMPVVIIVVLQMFLVVVGTLYGFSPTGERTDGDFLHDAAVASAFNRYEGLILYREPGFGVRASATDATTDTYKLRQLINAKEVPLEVLLKPVRERVFSMVIMRTDEKPWRFFSDELRAEVLANYELLYETCGEAFLVPKTAKGGDI